MDTISLHRSGGNGTVAKTGAKQNNNQTTTNNTTASVASSSALNKTSAGATNGNTASAEEAGEQPVANASTSITPAAGNTSVAEAPLASASEEAPAASTPAKKELNSAKKSAGSTSKLEKLNEKFNDLKYHIKGCQFAPGLTAGINSTFFAPESFKGFQFGFTGEFVFSESERLMSELKYFHRLNNNYALEDNYYKYEQAGGMYKKVLQTNSYSFSTLHSLELPLSVRYTSGKFCFFAGGNFLYTFSINTGAVSTPGPATAPTYVSAIGDDNAPKVTERDFASRFGVGYLFGASYQVSPNVFFDIRNVQTVWDNSGTAGSKYVSGQLYKNPSVQVSIGYRFGGNRSTED
jgi:hypothetical protein